MDVCSDYDTDLSIHNLDGSVVVCDVIPVMTKLRTVVSVPHESTPFLRLATTWCVLAAGKVQPVTSSWTVLSLLAIHVLVTHKSSTLSVPQTSSIKLARLADLCPDDIINWGPGVYDWGYTISLAANGVIHRSSVDADGNPTTIITGANSRQCLTFFGVEIYENMIFEDGVSGGDGGAILNPQFGKVTFWLCLPQQHPRKPRWSSL